MKRMMSFLPFFFALTLSLTAEEASDEKDCTGNADRQDPAEGYWIATNQFTGEHLCGWKFFVRNGKLCGIILSAQLSDSSTLGLRAHASYPDFPVKGDIRKMKLFGTPWIYGLEKKAEGVWRNGYIINPDDGNIYRCDITYHKADAHHAKDYVQMRGTLLRLGIGASQKWPAGTKEEAEGIK